MHLRLTRRRCCRARPASSTCASGPSRRCAAARDIGIRAIIVPYVADTKPFAPTLEQNARLLGASRRQRGPRARLGRPARPGELQRRSRARRRRSSRAAHRTGLHLHCSETRFSVERTRARVGRTPIAHLAELGALDARTLLAHCVWASEEDRALLAAAGAHVAHCPHANLKLGSGIAPIPDMRRRGINVTLATDGAKANNRLDMFDVMKFASLLHKGVARQSYGPASGRNPRDGNPKRRECAGTAGRLGVARAQSRSDSRPTR